MTKISSSQSAVMASWLVSGMDCASCAAKIRGAVERLPGVSDVKLSVMTETLTLALDEHQTKPTEVERKVSDLGYFVQRVEKPVREEGSNATSCGCGHAHEHNTAFTIMRNMFTTSTTTTPPCKTHPRRRIPAMACRATSMKPRRMA